MEDKESKVILPEEKTIPFGSLGRDTDSSSSTNTGGNTGSNSQGDNSEERGTVSANVQVIIKKGTGH
jgi:hypothetical protein